MDETPRVVPNGQVGDWRLDDLAFMETFRLPGARDKCDRLAEVNPWGRDARIRFLEEEHRYIIANAEAPRSVQARCSITGLVGRFHEHFDADAAIGMMKRGRQWAQKRALYLRDDGSDMTNSEIKAKWAFDGRVQSSRGTLMHYQIEQHLNGNVIEAPQSPEFRQFLGFERDVMRARGLRPFRTEASLFHCGLRLAGQCDMLCQDAHGRYHVLDWKRSKEIKRSNRYQKMLPPLNHLDDCNYWHYALQLNLYRFVLMSEYQLDIVSLCLGVFHPNQCEFQCIELPLLEAEVAAVVAHLQQRGEAGPSVPGVWAHFDGIALPELQEAEGAEEA
jgi:hypothetical protein